MKKSNEKKLNVKALSHPVDVKSGLFNKRNFIDI